LASNCRFEGNENVWLELIKINKISL
jgi:hypothetical protein